MNFEIKVLITGDWVELSLLKYETGEIVSVSRWQDQRNLSDELLSRISSICKRKKINLKNIREINFSCDCPYFTAKEKLSEAGLGVVDYSGRCGFTTWQTGEIITKVLNFAL
jgi:hypothetical protein